MGNKVSILVPIYGVEKYIEQCAVSLMEQTYENIEYIFVNDCTKDNSINILREVLERYPQRKCQVQIITHERNRGLAAARNTALDASTGDYLWHVDSDDWIAQDAVEKLVNKALKVKADIIIFDYYNVRRNGTSRSLINYKDRESYISDVLLHSIAGSVWNKFFNAVFYRNSGVRSIEGLNHGEDYAIIPRLLHKAQRISILDDALYYYNLTNQSSYTRNISVDSIMNVHHAYKINVDYFITAKDKDKYSSILDILPYRSMLALIKRADKRHYERIVHLYPECTENNCECLSKIDRIILMLLKYEKYNFLSIIIKTYKRLSKYYSPNSYN